ncbi:hypothetical protein [Maritalea porphyrae]|uniref:Uncharacterized protein n=1 Tax=Maritalea porphyrae TaxID=880732 RepID=A0ABQ5UPW3_9HYPH|nr:hypothetical protein [Maritalea porphyrae]GLQ15982.1 hypothetical protein GCM10007879_02310 [Maritalea porphyrae]
MQNPSYSWLTIHLAHFPKPLSSTDISFAGPPMAKAWRCGPDSPIGKDGFRTEISNIWAALGFYDDENTALQGLKHAANKLDFSNKSTENWHGLLAVVAHRGGVDFSTKQEPHPNLEALDTDPDGVMAVLTSAGYQGFDETDFDRAREFVRKVEDVRAFYKSLGANVVRQIFNPIGTPDGASFTVWRNSPDMLAAAYKDGTHRSMIDQHKAQPMFDRSSFTRFRLLQSIGTWEGIDPLEAAKMPPPNN